MGMLDIKMLLKLFSFNINEEHLLWGTNHQKYVYKCNQMTPHEIVEGNNVTTDR